MNVSTVFLGMDHNFFGEGPPILFETTIFGTVDDDYQERCSTWEKAEEMHKRAVEFAEELLIKANRLLEVTSNGKC